MSETSQAVVLAIGAHPDDIEFGCGGILLKERLSGSRISLAVCSKGEAGSNGTPEERESECQAAAAMLGGELTFFDFGGDGMMEARKAYQLEIANLIRRVRPTVVLAPSLEGNQHPDHAVVGSVVRDACRMARYGGVEDLKHLEPHAVDGLFYYAITPAAEPKGVNALLVDISIVYDQWVELMECHATQMNTRRYVDLQVARARSEGLQVGGEYAQALFANDRLLVECATQAPKGVRLF